jgi:hypothetical protein
MTATAKAFENIRQIEEEESKHLSTVDVENQRNIISAIVRTAMGKTEVSMMRTSDGTVERVVCTGKNGNVENARRMAITCAKSLQPLVPKFITPNNIYKSTTGPVAFQPPAPKAQARSSSIPMKPAILGEEKKDQNPAASVPMKPAILTEEKKAIKSATEYEDCVQYTIVSPPSKEAKILHNTMNYLNNVHLHCQKRFSSVLLYEEINNSFIHDKMLQYSNGYLYTPYSIFIIDKSFFFGYSHNLKLFIEKIMQGNMETKIKSTFIIFTCTEAVFNCVQYGGTFGMEYKSFDHIILNGEFHDPFNDDEDEDEDTDYEDEEKDLPPSKPIHVLKNITLEQFNTDEEENPDVQFYMNLMKDAVKHALADEPIDWVSTHLPESHSDKMEEVEQSTNKSKREREMIHLLFNLI